MSSPKSGVIFDSAGNLYGTTVQGGEVDYGMVYQLQHSGSDWTLNTLDSFNGSNGADPVGGLTMDAAGNLYGTTDTAGLQGNGTAFEIRPPAGWLLGTLYAFGNAFGPLGSLTLDAAGNLYGTVSSGGAYDRGAVFELTPGNGTWTYTSLHDFTGGTDGAYPNASSVTIDAAGNLYGTASQGGSGCNGAGYGVIWEITP